MSKPRDAAKEQFWRQTLAAWQESGLSVSAFCQQRQLQIQSFFRWQRRRRTSEGRALAKRSERTGPDNHRGCPGRCISPFHRGARRGLEEPLSRPTP